MIAYQLCNPFTKRVFRRDDEGDAKVVVHKLLQNPPGHLVGEVKKLWMQVFRIQNAPGQTAGEDVERIIFRVKCKAVVSGAKGIH